MLQPITLILLLGSYDPQTRFYLESVKEEIAKHFSGENLYALLLDNVEIYYVDTFQVLAELFNKDMVTLLVFQDSRLIDTYDVALKNGLDETVYGFLKEKYDVKRITKESIFNKFNSLMRITKSIFLIRDKEETRGGEYVELLHALFQGHSSKVWFLKREGIQLSAMLMEYLDKFKVNIRTYNNQEDLITAIMRILKYELPSK